MQKFIGFAQDSAGNLLTSGTWAAYLSGTTTPVTVYNTDSTADPVTSFTIPSTGLIQFYSRNGDRKVVATSGATTVTVDDFTMQAGLTYDVFANRPAAGSADRLFIATDTGRMYYDTGSAWSITPDNTLTKVGVNELANAALNAGLNMLNGTLVATVASSALTIAIKTLAGTDPSATDPVTVLFRNATAATGDNTVVSLTAATSLVIPSGASLGSVNSTAFRGWLVGFNDTSNTFRLGVINCLITSAGAGAGRNADSIYPLGQFPLASSTAIAAGSTSAQVFYTGTAVTSKPYAILGYFTYETGLATAGTYASAPTRLELYHRGVPLPGEVLQRQRTQTGASATGTTAVPDDDTIPQITEGDQYMSQAITPSSAANVLRVTARASLANSGAANEVCALFQDATANALAAAAHDAAANYQVQAIIDYQLLSQLSAATTFRIRAGGAAGTTTFNGASAARTLGGVNNSFLEAQEIMA